MVKICGEAALINIERRALDSPNEAIPAVLYDRSAERKSNESQKRPVRE